MENFKSEDSARISHHIKSISEDMHEIKKMITEKEKKNIKLSKKEQKRRESLKKAQKMFKNVSTNLKPDIYKKLEKRIEKLDISKSEYLKKLILEDLKAKKEDESKEKKN
jgi:uncharacterized protein with von Willebrand factor type A (vWA) domain